MTNTDKSFNRYLTSRERDELLYSKPPQAVRASGRRAKSETLRLLPPVIAHRDMHEASPPSITNREMRINAGVEDVPRSRTRQVKAKVKAHESFRWDVTVKRKIEENGLVFTEFV